MGSPVERNQRRKVTEVVLVDELIGSDSRRIWASLDFDGNLVVSGQDIGPKVARFFGTDEYEFAYTVPKKCLSEFFLILGLESVDNTFETIKHFTGLNYEKLADALAQANETMPVQFWSRP